MIPSGLQVGTGVRPVGSRGSDPVTNRSGAVAPAARLFTTRHPMLPMAESRSVIEISFVHWSWFIAAFTVTAALPSASSRPATTNRLSPRTHTTICCAAAAVFFTVTRVSMSKLPAAFAGMLVWIEYSS